MLKTPMYLMFFLFAFNSFGLSSEIQEAYETNLRRYESQYPDSSRMIRSSVKVVSLNIGLLKSPSEVPNFDQRSRLLSQQISTFLDSDSPDVMFLQEAWDDNPNNIVNIRAAARSKGYISIQESFENESNYSSSQARNGLDILVKENFVNQISGITEINFSSIARSAMAAVGGYDRGVLHAKLRLKSSQTILVATSHFTPNLAWPTYNQDSTRRRQASQAASIIKEAAGSETDFVIMGADLNFSPEFEHKINDGRDSDARDAVWEGSTRSYSIFVDESGLIDTYKIANSDVGYTQDRLLNPMANVSPSTDGEPEQRLDYVWAGSYKRDSAIVVQDSYLVFNTPLKDANGNIIPAEVYDGPLFMSDHFGVATELSLY